MIKRWLKRRDVRKFAANRWAMFSLAVVLTYLLVAVAVDAFGLIRKDQCLSTIGPPSVPGFGFTPLPEQRLINAGFYLDQIQLALNRSEPQASLEEIAIGPYRAADLPVDSLESQLNEAWRLYDELESEVMDDSSETAATLQQLQHKTMSLYAPLSPAAERERWFQLLLGTDNQGYSIFYRAIYSIAVAIKIGVVVAILSVLIGAILGGAAGYFGGVTDAVITWLFTTFSSIPNLVLLVLLAYMFTGTPFEGSLIPLYVAFVATYWIGPCRVIRGETLKLKELEYVQAAQALGLSRPRILLKHILPNTAHLMLINFSLLFVGAIKGEVILTYLGLGLKPGAGTSWGIMIDRSQPEVINGFFWQIGTATFLMFVLVLAFNILSDALQDAFDPKQL